MELAPETKVLKSDDLLEERNPTWQVIIFMLSMYVLFELFLETAFKLNSQQTEILTAVDNAICVIFICDFFYNVYHAKNKWGYLKWGWVDLVSSVPNVPFLRLGRFLRVLRILRGIRSARHLILFVNKRKSGHTLISVSLMSFIILTFASVAILNVESAPNSNIKTASDAIWWALTTMATVGYGDKYPVTMDGRIIAGVLMVSGLGLVGTFTAYVAGHFIQPHEKKHEATDKSIMDEIQEIKESLKRLEQRSL